MSTGVTSVFGAAPWLSRVRGVRGAREHLGLGVQLDVHLEPEHRLEQLERLVEVHQLVLGHQRAPSEDRCAVQQRCAPRVDEHGLERGADAVEARVLACGGEELDADGQPVLGGEPGGDRDARDAGEVGGNGRDVVQVHLHRVVDLLAEPERGRRRGRGRDHVDGANAVSKSCWMSVRTFCAEP